MTNGNDSINTWFEEYTEGGGSKQHTGLTKREYFAAMAMQGIVSIIKEIYGESRDAYKYAAEDAVKQADALINALNEKQ